jgi:hypothetical protein
MIDGQEYLIKTLASFIDPERLRLPIKGGLIIHSARQWNTDIQGN